MDSPKYVLHFFDPPTTLASLGESKHYESETNMHDHKCDEQYNCNVDEEEHMVEETLLGKPPEEVTRDVPTPCLQLVEHTPQLA